MVGNIDYQLDKVQGSRRKEPLSTHVRDSIEQVNRHKETHPNHEYLHPVGSGPEAPTTIPFLTTSSSQSQGCSAMINCQTVSKINPFFFKLLLSGYFITTIEQTKINANRFHQSNPRHWELSIMLSMGTISLNVGSKRLIISQ